MPIGLYSCSLEQELRHTKGYAGHMSELNNLIESLARMLGVVRISKLTDDTTSPARQRGHISHYAASNRGEVVHWAEDLDVSASKLSPFERPQLKPFLTQPDLIGSYDILVYWRLDRFVRSARDFRRILNWADQYNKILQSATEPMLRYDPNATGLQRAISEIIGIMAAAFAEIEASSISERSLDTKAYLRRNGFFGGGAIPLGYMPVPHPESPQRKTLIHSPLTYPIRREIIKMLLDRKIRREMADYYNAKKTPAPENLERIVRGKEPRTRKDGSQLIWTHNSFRRMFADETPLGYVMLNGKPVLDDKTGLPIQAYPPLMTRAELAEIQSIFAETPTPRSATACPIAGRVYCLECGRVRHHARQRYPNYYVDYLRCPNKSAPRGQEEAHCNAPSVRVDELLPAIEDKFMARLGDEPVVKWTYQPGEDHSEDLATAQSSLELVLSQMPVIKSEASKRIFSQQIMSLEETISRLESMPSSEATYVPEETGELYGDVWERSDWEGRRKLMDEARIKIYTTRRAKLEVRMSLEIPA